MSDRATLVQIYIAFYNRAPDPEGLAFWQAACDAGLTLPEIADLFVPQDESIGTYPFLGNPTEEGIRSFLKDVYENLFNREIDGPGETFWTNQILKSLNGDPDGLTIGEVILSIITGAQGTDITTLANKTEVALDFHDQAALLDDYVQNAEATTASRLALSVVDDSDFSVVQGKVLNENYFEEFDGQGNPLFDPFTPGIFDPILPPGDPGLETAPVNGILEGEQKNPHVAVLADGKVVIAYETEPNGDQIAFSIRNADGSRSLPDALVLTEDELNGAARAQDIPVVTALPDGGFIIAFESRLDGTTGFYAFVFDAMGARIEDPILVADRDDFGFIGEYDVTYLPTGNVLYSFTGDSGRDGGEDVYTKVLTPGGSLVRDVQQVSVEDGPGELGEEVASAALPDGTTLVVYHSNAAQDGDVQTVMGRIYDVNGVAQGAPFVINEFGASNQRNPDVTTLGEDRFAVVFQTRSGEFDPDNDGVSAVILNRDGSMDVDEFPVNVKTTSRQEDVQVTELPNGNFVVVWTTLADSLFDIALRVFEDDGTPVTGEILVNTLSRSPAGARNDPQVAATADGFVVTWEDTRGSIDDPFGDNIRMAAFDEDGVRINLPQTMNLNLPAVESNIFRVNDEVEDFQSQPKVVGLADGTKVYSYFDSFMDGSFFEVRDADGNVIMADAPILGDIPNAVNVDLTPTPDGGFIAVGRGGLNDGQGAGIIMQIFDADLNASEVLRVNTTNFPGVRTFDPEVVVDADGNIIVGWDFLENGDTAIKLRKFEADGTPLTGEVVVDTALAPIVQLQDLAVNDDGTVLVVGAVNNATFGGTSGRDIFMSILDADLDAIFTGLAPFNHVGQETTAVVAPLADGQFLIVTTDSAAPGDNSGTGIAGLIVNSDGTADGLEFLINTTTAGNQRDPAITVLEGGLVLVAWEGAGPDGLDLFGRLFNADGTPVSGSDFLIHPELAGNQTAISLASLPSNGFAATWITNPNASGSVDNNVAGAFFDSNFIAQDAPLVVPNNEFSIIRSDDILELQDIPLSGNPALFTITGFGTTALGTELTVLGPSQVQYNPFTLAQEISNLAPGEQLTEIFEYTVSNGSQSVTLVGSFQVQGFEGSILDVRLAPVDRGFNGPNTFGIEASQMGGPIFDLQPFSPDTNDGTLLSAPFHDGPDYYLASDGVFGDPVVVTEAGGKAVIGVDDATLDPGEEIKIIALEENASFTGAAPSPTVAANYGIEDVALNFLATGDGTIVFTPFSQLEGAPVAPVAFNYDAATDGTLGRVLFDAPDDFLTQQMIIETTGTLSISIIGIDFNTNFDSGFMP